MNNPLQDFVFVSKYARVNNGKKETYEEAVDRIISMHKMHMEIRCSVDPDTVDGLLSEVRGAYLLQHILGAQRALQWGGAQLMGKHERMYNCAATYADRVEFFGQLMFLLLAGAGVGYSVQQEHIVKMPTVIGADTQNKVVFTVPDSIEGWADSVNALFGSYFYGTSDVEFDFSRIRPKGSFISGGFRAPGHEPLKIALELSRKVLKGATNRKLTAVEISDLACIIADAVISGGVRRAALLAIFSVKDRDFLSYKTGNWFHTHPYRARVNISAAILPATTYDEYTELFAMAKQYGEPGIAFMESADYQYNPCFEVGMFPQIDGETGFSFCNLTEIVGKYMDNEESFYKACRVASILGTIQASYTDFPYLGKVTQDIVKRDALIGVGITGMAENPHILFNPDIQKRGAEIVKATNAEVAKILGISPAARTTVIKPSGNSAAMTGTSSGIHPFHAPRIIRNVQVNKVEQAGQVVSKQNPKQVEQSVYNDNDIILSFPMEMGDDVITKGGVSALSFLEYVKTTQNNWIEHGTNFEHPSSIENPTLRHNVSNTCTVNTPEWDLVKEYLWENKASFTGVSMLPASGDLDYPQAPFTEVLDEIELAEKYGLAAILAGGLNTDAIHVFGELWLAIDTALGRGEALELNKDEIADLVKNNINNGSFLYQINGVMVSDMNAILSYLEDKLQKKKEWVGRFRRFADKYLDGNFEDTGRCLKQVSIFHKWNNLRGIKPIDWNAVDWEQPLMEAGDQVGAACSGGKCEVIQ